MTWEQDMEFWNKPYMMLEIDPRIFSNVTVNSNTISGRVESNPIKEEYESEADPSKRTKLDRKGKIKGDFQFKLGHSTIGPVDEREFLEGLVQYDKDCEFCKGCTETWSFTRVKKW